MENVNFVPKDAQRILSSRKISQKYKIKILQYFQETPMLPGVSF